jgi:hypothetical protein
MFTASQNNTYQSCAQMQCRQDSSHVFNLEMFMIVSKQASSPRFPDNLQHLQRCKIAHEMYVSCSGRNNLVIYSCSY